MKVRVVISGRSYDTAAKMPEHVTLPEGCQIDEALQTVTELLPSGKGLPGSCLIAVSGTHLGTLDHHRPQVLADGDELVVIAPVAGG